MVDTDFERYVAARSGGSTSAAPAGLPTVCELLDRVTGAIGAVEDRFYDLRVALEPAMRARITAVETPTLVSRATQSEIVERLYAAVARLAVLDAAIRDTRGELDL